MYIAIALVKKKISSVAPRRVSFQITFVGSYLGVSSFAYLYRVPGTLYRYSSVRHSNLGKYSEVGSRYVICM